MHWDLPTEADTHALGCCLGRVAAARSVFAISGDLGAGKTVLCRGIAEGLGVKTRVTSPTFVLVAVYEGARLPFFHADLYRLKDASELDQLGLWDGAEAVRAVEWADRFPERLPADRLEVRLRHVASGREAELCATGPEHQALLDAVRPDTP